MEIRRYNFAKWPMIKMCKSPLSPPYTDGDRITLSEAVGTLLPGVTILVGIGEGGEYLSVRAEKREHLEHVFDQLSKMY